MSWEQGPRRKNDGVIASDACVCVCAALINKYSVKKSETFTFVYLNRLRKKNNLFFCYVGLYQSEDKSSLFFLYVFRSGRALAI